MSNPWFRLYSEFAHDPKVQSMSEAMQRRLIMVLCMRCGNDHVTLQDDEVAFHWRISNEELADTKALFIRKGFIDEDWNPLNWDKRQFVSDSSAERIRRHREHKKQACNVTVTPPDTDTDTDTESKHRAAKRKQDVDPTFERAWIEYPRKGDTSKKSSLKAWNARVKAGTDPEAMLAGVIRYALYCHAMQTENSYIKQPATFFGPDEHYLCAWDIPQRSVNANSRESVIAAFTGSGRQPAVFDGTAERVA